MRIIFCALIVGLWLPVQAMDKSGNYAIWGEGQKSCYRYLKERTTDGKDPYRTYIMGYLTAYNAIAPDTYSISSNLSLDEIMVWIDDYCDANQMSGLEQSLLEFVGNHHEKRYQQPPGRAGR
ncbi:MAG: hypothetical protein OXD47_11915 [Gammaproteobacteria bacterium]|nr:hypothetical protein [Gammaproteobacteria bacterium]MCY4339477.1 hypothetical protein [Gammaproteobacteria bacterium]